jgi:uncharacterized protein (TIGR03083 family)
VTSESVPARLLLTERDALLPPLRARPDADFDTATLLPGWSVRDVLAHCAAALTLTAAGTMHSGSPAENQVDVDHRRDWPVSRLLDELESGYESCAAAVAGAGGAYDGVALGEWVHGGDVRHAWGIADAWASAGVDDALTVLVARSLRPGSRLPATSVVLTDREPLRLGAGDPVAHLKTDTATFVRMMAGRSPAPARIDLTGAAVADYVVFG